VIQLDRRLESLPFDDWVAHVFDHSVTDPQWYFDLDAPVWAAPAALTLAHITRLFEKPVEYLSRYDDEQLNQGFWYLVGNSGSDHMFALTDASAPLSVRIRCVKSFTSLFRTLFAARCSSDLIHLRPAEFNPLNLACYMWWDIIPFSGAPNDPERAELDAAALSVMEEILLIESMPCRESALHGLGHWQPCYPQQVGDIIDRALSSSDPWTPDLEAYARSAQSGCVL
jgi:hypothetical protein